MTVDEPIQTKNNRLSGREKFLAWFSKRSIFIKIILFSILYFILIPMWIWPQLKTKKSKQVFISAWGIGLLIFNLAIAPSNNQESKSQVAGVRETQTVEKENKEIRESVGVENKKLEAEKENVRIVKETQEKTKKDEEAKIAQETARQAEEVRVKVEEQKTIATQQAEEVQRKSFADTTPAPEPVHEPQSTKLYFKNCTAAKNAGYYNILRGEPGYASHLDKNNDGVACEVK
jgi:hypothetical protein